MTAARFGGLFETGEMNMTYTTQKELRRAFWAQHPHLPRRKIRNYAGNGTMYPTDTRCAWHDWLDYMKKNGRISDSLADCATLSND